MTTTSIERLRGARDASAIDVVFVVALLLLPSPAGIDLARIEFTSERTETRPPELHATASMSRIAFQFDCENINTRPSDNNAPAQPFRGDGMQRAIFNLISLPSSLLASIDEPLSPPRIDSIHR